MFMGPLEAVKPWQTGQVQGVVRFRDKVFQLVKRSARKNLNSDMSLIDSPEIESLRRDMHKTIKKVTNDIDSMSFNTAISALMIYTNTLSAHKTLESLPCDLVENLVLLLSPFAPHCSEEFWEILGHEKSLMYHPWPTFNEALCIQSKNTVVIQVNGKKRETIEVEKEQSKETVLKIALQRSLSKNRSRQGGSTNAAHNVATTHLT